MTKQRTTPPILVAAFSTEGQIGEVILALMRSNVSPDFIGAFVGEGNNQPHEGSKLNLVSVLAPRRLHEKIIAILREHGAEAIGDVAAMSALYGHVPHPGSREDGEVKLPTGPEYWQVMVSYHKARNSKEKARNSKE